MKARAVACIARRDTGWTYCRRDIDRGEFTFKDAEYAIRRHKDDEHLQACPGCVEGYAQIESSSGKAEDIRHVSTRDNE